MSIPAIENLDDLASIFGMPKFVVTQLIFQADRYYAEFSISKKAGRGRRKLAAPSRRLKGIQRWILDNILAKVPVSSACTGYIRHRSIISNASPHQKKRFVMNADLLNFFPSISLRRVIGLFQSLGYDRTVAFGLAKLCCYKGALPQGAPSSPMIANLICWKLDARLKCFADSRGWKFTRYSDDITISGDSGFDSENAILTKIVNSEGFSLNHSKYRVMRSNSRQQVTGLVVNQKINLSRQFKRSLRAAMHQLRLEPAKFAMRKDELLGRICHLEHICGASNMTESYRRLLIEAYPDKQIEKGSSSKQ